MMTAKTYEQLILEGIKSLPAEALAEVAVFVYLVRERILAPDAFEEDLQNLLIKAQLSRLSEQEEAHLEKEFEGYGERYPRE